MKKTIELTINGLCIMAEEGATILEVCRQNGIEIPTLCHIKNLPADGACRLCLVEVAGAKNLMTACSTPVSGGMAVQTDSEKVVSARRDVLDLLLSTHRTDCFNCKKMGQCDLHAYCEAYGVEISRYPGENKAYAVDASNPFFEFDKSKCILCRKCVRVCGQLQCIGALGLSGRGFATHVTPENERELEESVCVSCGNCVSHCPTGALSPKRRVSAVGAEKVLTVCSYCGVGCQMQLLVKNGRIIGAEPADGAANQGLFCVKGKFGYQYLDHPDRLKTPLIRKNGKLEEATWEEAYALVASKIQEIKQTCGADAIMGAASAKCTVEENYAFQKMMRAAIGTNNVDHCARL